LDSSTFSHLQEAAARLRSALQAGAFSDADETGDAILGRLQRGSAAAAEVLHPILEWLVTTGRREEACALASGHAELLATTDALASMATVLDVGPAPGFVLPSGRLNLVAIARAEARGTLDISEVRLLLSRHPLTRRLWPHAHLLLWNAACLMSPDLAVSALNRFLASQRNGPATLSAGTTMPLGRLRLRRRASTSGPFVSVIMAARNAADTVGYALRSLLGQSHTSLEVLCCDDASADATLDVLGTFRRDPRVRLFRSLTPQGPYNIRNALLAHARGAWIAFHDADDVAMPDRIARQLCAMRRSGAIVAIGQTLRMAPSGRIAFFPSQNVLRLALFSTLYARRVIDTLGAFFPAKVGADLDYYERARETFGERYVQRIPEALFLSLWADGSLTRQPGLESLEDGYRAPIRRSYCQWSYERRVGRKSQAQLEAALVASGNVLPAAPVVSP
jgi:Glycosyl transferase family 2